METLNFRSPRGPKRSPILPRSVSPNSVVINGQIIDKKPSENIVLPKKMFLDNILEESDPLLHQHTGEHTGASLEEVVKKADENVQNFIEQMSSNTYIQGCAKEFESVCKDSQEELRGLSKFLASIDDNSKNKIVETLINVYKAEISSGINNVPKQQNVRVQEEKVSKFKNVCKDIMNEYQNKQLPKVSTPKYANSEPTQYERIDYIAPTLIQQPERRVQNEFKPDHFQFPAATNNLQQHSPSSKYLQSNFTVNYQTNSELSEAKNTENVGFSLENLLDSQLSSDFENFERYENPFTTDIFSKQRSYGPPKYQANKQNVKTVSANLPLEVRQSKEIAINRILGREPIELVTQPKHLLKKYSKEISNEHIIEGDRKSAKYYQNTKDLIANPGLPRLKHLISEGIQTSLTSQNRLRKARRSNKNVSFDFVKPFKYHLNESKSDIAITCPFGCKLRLKRSNSDTDVTLLKDFKKKPIKYNRNKTFESKENKPSMITIERKPSWELLKAKDIRKKHQLISYQDQNLKRGDSEFQFSQILFERTNKNMENDISSLEIPVVNQKQIEHFNANYLLHSLRIAKESKPEILPKVSIQYLCNASDFSISDEDYEAWLKKQNWVKYSNYVHESKSLDQLRSVSEAANDKGGDYKYYLDRGDYTPKSSKVGQASSILSDLSDNFLYEHVVISRAVNFFLSFNAKRTRTLNSWDRCNQILFFALFYGVWVFFSKYVYAETKSNKGVMLWH